MINNNNHLTESEEDYLEAVYIINKNNGICHAVDVVNFLGLKKSSVSVAFTKLEEKGYLVKPTPRSVALTEEGMKVASIVYERHAFFKEKLISLGVEEDRAEDEACSLEHDISHDTFLKIKAYLEKAGL